MEVVLAVALLALIFVPGYMLLNDNLLTESVSLDKTVLTFLAKQKMEEMLAKSFGELYAKIPANESYYEEEEKDIEYNGLVFNRKTKIIFKNNCLLQLVVTVESENGKGGAVTIATFKGRFD
ncbi:hypothetical protein ATZ99_14740 [Thermovenabulum gondwanense]|uniref:ComG operon protein 7 n=1 Tax=Thermovenabulum gondwanense TaxID=520767 RepID=A0A162MH31_9FIRM|nr:hypothetical protein ATZ99_14740 [Thermovenabulum gondwanense]